MKIVQNISTEIEGEIFRVARVLTGMREQEQTAAIEFQARGESRAEVNSHLILETTP